MKAYYVCWKLFASDAPDPIYVLPDGSWNVAVSADDWHLADVKVFLTKEDAEQHLKEIERTGQLIDTDIIEVAEFDV